MRYTHNTVLQKFTTNVLYAGVLSLLIAFSTTTTFSQALNVKDASNNSLLYVMPGAAGNLAKVGIGGVTSPSAALHIAGNEGIIATGTWLSGTVSNLGAGTRLHWYPKKAAFRAGYVDLAQWNDANIGDFSTAMGYATTASGVYSTAMGDGTTASGNASTAMGYSTTASGNESTAMGYATTASGNYSTAMGDGTTASGDWSTAMGPYVSTNSQAGSFIIGDHSTTTTTNSSAANEMTMRFAGGYRLFSNTALSTGVSLASGGNSWGTISDSTKKENFKHVDSEGMLRNVSTLHLGSWNYKGQDPAHFRHYGPMAQEFFSAFGHDCIGTIGNDTTIASADIDGVMMIALQALEQRTAELQEQNTEIRKENADLRVRLAKVEAMLQELSTRHLVKAE